MSSRDAQFPRSASQADRTPLITQRRFVSSLMGARADAPASAMLIHRALDAFVDEARASGWMVEAVIIAVKHCVSEADLIPVSAPALDLPEPGAREPRVTRLVTWTIQRYYGRSIHLEAT
jgi:hypothetical protein